MKIACVKCINAALALCHSHRHICQIGNCFARVCSHDDGHCISKAISVILSTYVLSVTCPGMMSSPLPFILPVGNNKHRPYPVQS